MKLWVDDIRPAPEGWTLAKDFDQATFYLQTEEVEEVSLDHDLGDFGADGREWTGYDILMFIVQRKIESYPVPRTVKVHSANPVAQDRMNGVIKRYL